MHFSCIDVILLYYGQQHVSATHVSAVYIAPNTINNFYFILFHYSTVNFKQKLLRFLISRTDSDTF